jgi:hypothetical protein
MQKKFIFLFLIFTNSPQNINAAQATGKKTLILNILKKHLESNASTLVESTIKKIKDKKFAEKEATILLYIAADNDLHYFAWKNIRELAKVAPQNINIVVQLNEPGRHKKTQRYLIDKGKAFELNKNSNEKYDSGSAETLIDFCKFSIDKFPARDYVLILWNHGTGILDPLRKRKSVDEYFQFNPTTLMVEVDRNIGFLDLIEKKETKGICFDDHFNTYLTNQKLEKALKEITENALGGKKFSIIGMDACLMSMVEVANLFKKYCHIMIGSQEVELGAGWRYDKILKFYSSRNLHGFAKHIVESYREAYQSINSDYTLSAINLDKIEELEENINRFSQSLLNALQHQIDASVRNLIKKSKERIGFDEPSYIDLHSFCTLIANNINKCQMNNESNIKQQVINDAQACTKTVEKIVIANSTGRNVPFAKGLSIYLPEKNRGIHPSYRKTNFALSNNWINFLNQYILS